MKIINAPSRGAYLASIVHKGRRMQFSFISVTRPTLAMDSVDVLVNGQVLKTIGRSYWHPIEFEVDKQNYDFVIKNSPRCNIEFSIGKDNFLMMECYVRADSVPDQILKIHTNNVRMF